MPFRYGKLIANLLDTDCRSRKFVRSALLLAIFDKTTKTDFSRIQRTDHGDIRTNHRLIRLDSNTHALLDRKGVSGSKCRQRSRQFAGLRHHPRKLFPGFPASIHQQVEILGFAQSQGPHQNAKKHCKCEKSFHNAMRLRLTNTTIVRKSPADKRKGVFS